MAEITQAAEAAKAAARFQDAADSLKKQAALVRDPAERERLWQAAYAKEKEAHGESKKARCKSNFETCCPRVKIISGHHRETDNHFPLLQ